MLFSEPKIPQSEIAARLRDEVAGFSALQRAENSSIKSANTNDPALVTVFQCSSASRKFLNRRRRLRHRVARQQVSVLFSEPKIPQSSRAVIYRFSSLGFSALQRAENSSIQQALDAMTELAKFQCSSASRKFLNRAVPQAPVGLVVVSVLFSEPKIPQL